MAIYQGHNEDSSGNLLLSIGNGMTATVETGSTASQAYTKGSYLFFNNRLCKAASAIASGATLTIGGNLTQTSLGAEITSHLRSSDGKEFYFDVKDGTYGYYPSASKTASEFVPFGGTSSVIVGTSNSYNDSRLLYIPNSDMSQAQYTGVANPATISNVASIRRNTTSGRVYITAYKNCTAYVMPISGGSTIQLTANVETDLGYVGRDITIVICGY